LRNFGLVRALRPIWAISLATRLTSTSYAYAFQQALADAGIECSMSRRGNWDKAVAESLFSTVKTELIYNLIFTTKASAHSVIGEWIGVFYNAYRRHSSAGNLAPAEYERRFYANHNAALAA
jgi:transposase InsO family protein